MLWLVSPVWSICKRSGHAGNLCTEYTSFLVLKHISFYVVIMWTLQPTKTVPPSPRAGRSAIFDFFDLIDSSLLGKPFERILSRRATVVDRFGIWSVFMADFAVMTGEVSPLMVLRCLLAFGRCSPEVGRGLRLFVRVAAGDWLC